MEGSLLGAALALKTAYTSMSRPVTAITNFFEKITSGSISKKSTNFSAQALLKVLDAYIKHQTKADEVKLDVIRALETWNAERPDPLSYELSMGFTSFLEEINLCITPQTHHFQQLKHRLGTVEIREARQLDMKKKHLDLVKKQDEAAGKHGPNAIEALILKDQIDESNFNMGLLEGQIAEAAEDCLLSSFKDIAEWIAENFRYLGAHAENVKVGVVELESQILKRQEEVRHDKSIGISRRLYFPKGMKRGSRSTLFWKRNG